MKKISVLLWLIVLLTFFIVSFVVEGKEERNEAFFSFKINGQAIRLMDTETYVINTFGAPISQGTSVNKQVENAGPVSKKYTYKDFSVNFWGKDNNSCSVYAIVLLNSKNSTLRGLKIRDSFQKAKRLYPEWFYYFKGFNSGSDTFEVKGETENTSLWALRIDVKNDKVTGISLIIH